MQLRILNYQLSIINSHLEQNPTQKHFNLFNDVRLAKKTFCKPAKRNSKIKRSKLWL